MDRRCLMNYKMENNLLQNDDLQAKILSFVTKSNFEESNNSLSINSNFIPQVKKKVGKIKANKCSI